MTPERASQLRAVSCLLVLLATGEAVAVAQTAAASPPQSPASATDPAPQPPKRMSVVFNLELTWGTFGFADTLFSGAGNPGDRLAEILFGRTMVAVAVALGG